MEPYVWLYDLAARRWRRRAPKNVAVLRHYYAYRDGDAQLVNVIESRFADVESLGATLIRKLVSRTPLTGDEPLHFSLFIAQLAVRTPQHRPRGGEWLDDETRAWREAGVDVVVSLLEPREEAELALACEAVSSVASGLEFRSFPIPDRGLPDSLESVGELTRHIVNALQEGKNVAVHCRQGIGRSALIAAAALISGGHAAETAVQKVGRARGFEVPETHAQREWISDFSSWLADTRAAQRGAATDRGQRPPR